MSAFQERAAYYKDLAPGFYRFRVTADNSDGIRNPDGVSFDFTLKRYIYETAWFKICAVLLAISAALLSFFRFKKYLYFRKLKIKYKSSTLDPEKAELALKKLRYLLEVKKVFKDENLSLKLLAAKLIISPRYLSQVINEQMNKNFWELINGYRIEEAKKMLLDPGEKDSSVLEIAFEAGFSSKESFYRAFKKCTGKTPIQFKKDPAAL